MPETRRTRLARMRQRDEELDRRVDSILERIV